MLLRPPGSTRTYTLFPYSTPFRSSSGPADTDSHGSLAFIERCARYSDHLRAEALRCWLASMRSKARFQTCQYIAGEPNRNDACKCGAPETNGVYCADHLAPCSGKPSAHKPAPTA